MLLAAGTAAVSFLSSCTTANTATRSIFVTDTPPGVYLPASEFEYVYVTGSRLPVRVLKNAPKRELPDTASHVVARSPEAFESIVNAGLNTGR